MNVRILLADDHPLIRAGIRATLAMVSDFYLVGEACNGDKAQKMSLALRPCTIESANRDNLNFQIRK